MDEKTIPLNKLPVDVKARLSGGKLAAPLDYRALFEQMGESVFIIGLDLRIMTVNPRALGLLGYEESQLMGTPLEEVMPLRDPSGQELTLGHPLNFTEQTLKKKDGSIIPVEISLSVVHDENNKPIYLQMIARDITERKQADRSLKRHMRALSVIGEVTAALFRSENIEERIPEVLESLGYAVGVFGCVIFDVDFESVKLRSLWLDETNGGFDVVSVLNPFGPSLLEMPERVFSVTDVITKNEKVPTVSLLIIPIQGKLRRWGFLGLIDKDDRLSWLPSIFDIVQTTASLIGAALERVHYEETLRLSEARNRILVDSLPDLLLRIDLSGRILDYNANPEHPLYYISESVVGRNLRELWTDEIVESIIGRENAETFTISRWVNEFRLPDQENTFEARLHPISEREALIIVRDITELARLNQMKSDFINRASHELRTPLTAAILMAELIQGGGTEDELAEYWRTLTSELNRQKNLINQLLMAGRLESGKMKIEAVRMDLVPTLQESVQAVKAMAARRKITISLNCPFADMVVFGDKSALEQVFINLISNAVKFSAEGGTVEVEAGIGAGEARVSIADHGLGIPPDAIPHLFERFFRAKNVTVAEVPGSGVGLYIVKSIVDELGGRIDVNSELNKGTTFTVHLRMAG